MPFFLTKRYCKYQPMKRGIITYWMLFNWDQRIKGHSIFFLLNALLTTWVTTPIPLLPHHHNSANTSPVAPIQSSTLPTKPSHPDPSIQKHKLFIQINCWVFRGENNIKETSALYTKGCIYKKNGRFIHTLKLHVHLFCAKWG